MNELQRQAYLEAMGVDCYMPRLQLPAAPQALLCEMPVQEGPVIASVEVASVAAVSPAVAPTKTAVNNGAAAMQALFDEEPKEKTARVTAALSSQQSTAKVPPQGNPHFSLSIIRGENILLIDEGLAGDINPADYLQLLHNLLFALGAGKQQLSIDAFVWPMRKNSQVDQSENAARETLAAFLAKQVQQLSTRYIILMGDTAVKYLLDTELATGEFSAHAQLDAQLIRTQSVSPLLSSPALKRDVWRDLQPLHRVLKKG